MKTYRIVTAPDIQLLETFIVDAINQGYLPIGQIIQFKDPTGTEMFGQAMLKKDMMHFL